MAFAAAGGAVVALGGKPAGQRFPGLRAGTGVHRIQQIGGPHIGVNQRQAFQVGDGDGERLRVRQETIGHLDDDIIDAAM